MKLDIAELGLLGAKEAAAFLEIKPQTLYKLMERYTIPHQVLACGTIFLKADLEAFQKARAARLKHRAKFKSCI